jgi:glycerol-3-phosphate O-acyltransferase
LKEMIAEPRPFFIDWAGRITRSIISLAYGKEIVCSPEGVERTREVLRDHPAALLWTHKSHIDGMALMSVMYDNDLPTPHSFGGINMAFAGAGSLGRRSGIIYIRRTFQDNPVYKLVFRQYLGYLMEKRFPFSWAFEGTRSRVGKLMPPRYGLFKYILEAAYATGASDLHFIPVSISYDLIGEAPDYAREQAGQKKRPESLAWFLGYLRRLRAPMGRVYLDFAEPVVIDGPAPEPEQVDMPKLAFEIAVRVNRITPVTFPAVACIVLLSAAPRAITIEEFRHNTIELVRWLRQRNIRLTDSFDEGHDQQLNELAQMALDRGLLSEYKEGPDAVYGISEDQYAIAGYYRNTIVHYFVIKAMLELALARAAEVPADERRETFRAEADRLRDLFKFEFFYSEKKAFQRQIDRELKRYVSEPQTVFDGDTEQLWQTIAGLAPLLAHATLLPFVEAYMIVAEVLARLEPGTGIEEKECVGAALKFGQQSLLQRRISSRASIAKVMFTNGYRLFRNMGLTQGGDPATAARREAMSREFAALSHRLARIQSLAHTAFSNHSAHRPEPGPVQNPGG